jgi:hypothetical protein
MDRTNRIFQDEQEDEIVVPALEGPVNLEKPLVG